MSAVIIPFPKPKSRVPDEYAAYVRVMLGDNLRDDEDDEMGIPHEWTAEHWERVAADESDEYSRRGFLAVADELRRRGCVEASRG